MFEGEEVLTKAANDGVLQDAEWAQIFSSVLERLEHNVFREFAIPSSGASRSQAATQTGASTGDTDEPQPESEQLAQVHPQPPNMQPTTNENPIIPPPLQATYDYIRQSLTSQFTTCPPHTIQRLAELILYPKQHHRFLHAYLNALDRVVSVSSGLNAIPTGAGTTAPHGESLVNGIHAATTPLGSDESLGGALLTPIPWLRDPPADSASSSPSQAAATPSPSDATSSTASDVATPDSTSTDSTLPPAPGPERPDGAITQGELLRQEQRSAAAPPTPVGSAVTTRLGSPEQPARLPEDGEEPHARGPEAIGMEDTGPQDRAVGTGGPAVLDMEAAAGRGHAREGGSRAAASTSTSTSAPTPTAGEEDSGTADEKAEGKDADGDVELVDADGADVESNDKEAVGDTERSTAPAASDATGR